jgi:uncharacterized protein YhhL (DUF1145 family)
MTQQPPDVSMALEHARHYLVLAHEQIDVLHGSLKNNQQTEISNRISWLIYDAYKILQMAKNELYPDQEAG